MAKQILTPKYSGKCLDPNWGPANKGSMAPSASPGPGKESKGSVTPVRQAGEGHQSHSGK